jgi:predicted outer membrane repeat protein
VIARLKKRLVHERGSVAVITAVMMVPMLGFAALAVDMGNWYQARKAAQAAADAGALAGAQDLPSSSSNATTDATTYANKNLAGRISGASVSVSTPYNSNSNQIKVTITASNVPSIFGSILGVSSETITASAVAQANSGGGPAAIFANDSTCSDNSVLINSNNPSISGTIDSNGNFDYQGNKGGSFGTVAYGNGTNSCSPSWGGASYTSQVHNTTSQPWPLDFRTLTNPCTSPPSGDTVYNLSASTSWNSGSYPSGIYCLTGSGGWTFTIGSVTCSPCTIYDETTNGVTINFDGNGGTFSPLWNGLFVYTAASDSSGSAVTLDGNGSTNFGGAIFAPNGTILENANNWSTTAFLEANKVKITGSGFTLSGVSGGWSGNSGTGYLVQ